MENMAHGYVGKIIAGIELQDDCLSISFADGTGVCLFDDGQDCCERRYMHTDDCLSEVVGGQLYAIEIRDAPDEGGGDGYDEVHEVQFLVVKTSKGECVVCTHNEHNGYYGGFRIVIRPMTN